LLSGRRKEGADFPPGGAGRDAVLAVCGGCHEINRVTAGYTPEGWRTVVRMMQNFGAPGFETSPFARRHNHNGKIMNAVGFLVTH